MKKLLTIICALSLVLAFSMPAVALDDIEDNNTAAVLWSPGADTNLAGDDVSQDNDGTDVDVTTGDLLSNNDSNDDNSITESYNDNSTNSQANGNTDVKVELDDIASNNDNREDYVETSGDVATKGGEVDKSVDNEREDYAENNGDAAWKGGEINNSEETYDGDVATKGGEITKVEMDDNKAAAAMGGTAIAVEIEDIELNLASTTSWSGIYQESNYESKAEAGAFFVKDDIEAYSKFESKCHSINASVHDNTGLTGVNFTAGHFNNNANLNNVTMTVQY